MAETPTTRIWLGRSIFLAIATVLVFAQLLPLDTRPHIWAAPDWLLGGHFGLGVSSA